MTTEKQIDAYSVDAVRLVGMALTRFAQVAAAEYPEAANLAVEIAGPLLAAVKQHRDAEKKAAEATEAGACEKNKILLN